MKYLIIPLLFVSVATFSQEHNQYFALIYTTGAKWDTTKAHHEQPFFNEHSKYLSSLRKSGKIAMGARYSDKGLIVLKVKDENEANEIVAADQSVQHGTFKGELFLMNVFYPGFVGVKKED